jgi:hypothetical protein
MLSCDCLGLPQTVNFILKTHSRRIVFQILPQIVKFVLLKGQDNIVIQIPTKVLKIHIQSNPPIIFSYMYETSNPQIMSNQKDTFGIQKCMVS